MKVVAQGRVFINGRLYTKGEELDVNGSENTIKEFIKSRMLLPKGEITETAEATASQGRYQRRDQRAANTD